MVKKEGLGVIGAFITVLIILGLIALAANYFGWLPADGIWR
jgi:hypothetical protein